MSISFFFFFISLMAFDSKNSSATTGVSEQMISKAVDSLVKWVNSKTKPENPQLLDHDELLYLVLTIKKIPATSKISPFKIPLPHPIVSIDGTQEICLIIDDRSNRIDSKTTKQRIEQEKIPITKVLRLSKLKSNYRPFESKRQLCESYDLFFADRRVIPLLPKLLGKTFFKTKKIPIPVDLTHKNWKEQIEHACGSCLLYLRTGTCSVVKVAKVSQSREEIVKNVAAAIEGIAEIIPKKWDNVRSLHLKSLNSVALPLYQSIPQTGLKIEVPKNAVTEESKNQIESGDEETRKISSGRKDVKKGKIKLFRYMDHNLDNMTEDLSSDDNGNQIEELGLTEKAGKKRKKAAAKLDQASDSEMDGGSYSEQLEKSSKRSEVERKKENKATSSEIPVSSTFLSLDSGKKKKKKREATNSEMPVSSSIPSLDAGKKTKKREATNCEMPESSSFPSLDAGKKKKKEAENGEDVGKKKKGSKPGEFADNDTEEKRKRARRSIKQGKL